MKRYHLIAYIPETLLFDEVKTEALSCRKDLVQEKAIRKQLVVRSVKLHSCM